MSTYGYRRRPLRRDGPRITIQSREVTLGQRPDALEYQVGQLVLGQWHLSVLSLPYQHRRDARSQVALDCRQNLRFVFDEHVVVGGKGGRHLIQVVELAIEDEDVAIDLGIEPGSPDLVWLKRGIAF